MTKKCFGEFTQSQGRVRQAVSLSSSELRQCRQANSLLYFGTIVEFAYRSCGSLLRSRQQLSYSVVVLKFLVKTLSNDDESSSSLRAKSRRQLDSLHGVSPSVSATPLEIRRH